MGAGQEGCGARDRHRLRTRAEQRPPRRQGPSPWPGPAARAGCAATRHGRCQLPAAAAGGRRARLHGGEPGLGLSGGVICILECFKAGDGRLGRPQTRWPHCQRGTPARGSRKPLSHLPASWEAMPSSKQGSGPRYAQQAVRGVILPAVRCVQLRVGARGANVRDVRKPSLAGRLPLAFHASSGSVSTVAGHGLIAHTFLVSVAVVAG